MKINTTVTLDKEVRDKALVIFEERSQKMSAVINNYLKSIILEVENERSRS